MEEFRSFEEGFMSEWRMIWIEALSANRTLLNNLDEGENEFDDLLVKYDSDGMVFYERAEAYELLEDQNNLKDYKNALLNYERAIEEFPVDHWKKVAQLGKNRILGKLYEKKDIDPNQQWSIFHRIHALQEIDLITVFDALVAITLYDSEPHETALLLRCCLESIVLLLLPDIDDDEKDKGLWVLINKYEENCYKRNIQIETGIISKMHRVRRIGNKAAHPKDRLVYKSFPECVQPFIEVAEWANRELKLFHINIPEVSKQSPTK
jgi:hypothetical protein